MQSVAKRCECGKIDLKSATSERSFGSHSYPELVRDIAPVCNFAIRGSGLIEVFAKPVLCLGDWSIE